MKKKGGSIASNKVNSLVNKNCALNGFPKAEQIKISNDFYTKNYGIDYKTTGGSIKRKNKAKKTKKKINKKKGGGDTVPPTFLQKFTSYFDGSNPSQIDYTNFLDLNKTPTIFSQAPLPNISLSSKGLDMGRRGNVDFNNAQPSGPYSWLDSWKNPVTSELPSESIMKEYGTNPLNSNNMGYLQAGGASKKKRKEKEGGHPIGEAQYILEAQ